VSTPCPHLPVGPCLLQWKIPAPVVLANTHEQRTGGPVTLCSNVCPVCRQTGTASACCPQSACYHGVGPRHLLNPATFGFVCCGASVCLPPWRPTRAECMQLSSCQHPPSRSMQLSSCQHPPSAPCSCHHANTPLPPPLHPMRCRQAGGRRRPT
jgi:hypothetical protein